MTGCLFLRFSVVQREKREEIMMMATITTHQIIVNECLAEGIDYDEMDEVIRYLLEMFNDGKEYADAQGLAWVSNESKKIPYRTKFLDIVAHPWKYTMEQKRAFAWKVACETWFEGKSALVLDQMKAFAADVVVLAKIVDEMYLRGKNRLVSNDTMIMETGIPNTRFFKVKKDAIVLFGLLIWKYCKRRDMEDKINGIIDENGNKIED